MQKQWNPRYVCYAKSKGMTPAEALKNDTEQYPGGKMCGFTLWIQARWHDWRTLRNLARDYPLSDAHYDDFDVWLAEQIQSASK